MSVLMPFNEVMLFTLKIRLLIEQNTNETKQDISIMKLNISNLYKAIITTERLLFFKKKGLFQLTVDNKVSALPRLTSDENLLIGRLQNSPYFCVFK